MLPLLNRTAVRALDQDAVTRLGLPSIVLMENAGRGALDVISERFADRLAHVALIGGVGQNGGDAWVIARHLVMGGASPRCVLVGARADVAGDAKVNLDTLIALGVDVRETSRDGLGVIDEALATATLVIDGLFGTGLTRAIEGVHAEVIERINGCGVPVVALDLPSGIDADTGAILGSAVHATLTVTFAARKPGLYQYPGAELAGVVMCVPIGVPVPSEAPTRLIEASDVSAILPPRRRDAHKGTAGHVVIVAGSPGTTGAAVLSALGALRIGAGLVTVFTRGSAHEITERHPEIMVRSLATTLPDALQEVLAFAADKRAAVVGPGLGLDPFGRDLALGLAARLTIPTVLDADALTAIGDQLTSAGAAVGPRVLTPHPGEASRLSGTSTAQIQADRYAVARRLAARSGAVVVLKGAATIVALADGTAWVCDRGTPALGVAGTGDVLAGVIGALLAQARTVDAAVAGVYVHATAGELATDQDRGLLASEVAAALPRALAACRD